MKVINITKLDEECFEVTISPERARYVFESLEEALEALPCLEEIKGEL